jgi:hypothetical protein
MNAPLFFDIFRTVERKDTLFDYISRVSNVKSSRQSHEPAGTITIGHSSPFAAWHVEIVTLCATIITYQSVTGPSNYV